MKVLINSYFSVNPLKHTDGYVFKMVEYFQDSSEEHNLKKIQFINNFVI